MTDFLKFLGKPKLRNPAMVVCWDSDAGQLGAKTVAHLKRELGAEEFCDIDPVEFFPLGGVSIENDVVEFPESSFYAIPDRDLVIFYSTIPRYEWFKFLNLIVDVAQEHCRVREMYTIGGMIALGAHTAPRDFWATFSSPQIKKSLAPYELSRELDFETPPGGRPTLNSFLLWTAKQRNLQGANLWVPVPFYLISADDPRSQKRVLSFLNDRLNLGFNFTRIDAEITRLDEWLANLRREQVEIDRSITKLEGNQRLSDTEHEKLVKEVEEYLKKQEG
ncbi:MAG: PAC2 family protein [Dehalococcoidia bacterium]|nr:PAC2 family protein [Dehalococcoidia bacterium]